MSHQSHLPDNLPLCNIRCILKIINFNIISFLQPPVASNVLSQNFLPGNLFPNAPDQLIPC